MIIRLIILDDDGFFRIRILFDNLNSNIVVPSEASDVIKDKTGPMIDFVDNFPPQLIYYPEDKQVFLEEAEMSLKWHTDIVGALLDSYSPNVVIHDTYTPNQMLTSKWWMGYLDPSSDRYNDVNEAERNQLWSEVQHMYKKLDDIVGEILKRADKDTIIVFSSDHGAVPLNKWVNLNNLFAKKGWISYQNDKSTGETNIDWEHSQVVYLKMAHVYINPAGLSGDYERASGGEYEKLRDEVIDLLSNLEDENGERPVVDIIKWENATEFLRMDSDRAGDLIIANKPGFGWNEEISADLEVFSIPLKTGYKQAILAEETKGMWTPFIMAGPGIKSGSFLGSTPIDIVDQYPTIMTALEQPIHQRVQGRVLDIFK